MGAAKRKKQAKVNLLVQDINAQSDEDIVQLPLQQADGWFRGISGYWIPTALDTWYKHCPDKEIWIYRIDKYWVKQKWQTKGGNYADRGDLIVQVETNEFAKAVFLATVDRPEYRDAYEAQIEATKRGENGCVQFWMFRRFLLTRSITEAQKLPVNYWEYYPIVDVYRPDGSYEQQAVDMNEYMGSVKSIYQDPAGIESAAPWEMELFDRLVTCEVL
ncbi:MAG: hypothetical protein ACO4CS_16100 [bacterium]